MRFPIQFTRRTLLIVLMILSAVACALPMGVSNYLRGRLDLILSPLADGGTVVTTTLRDRANTLRWRPGASDEAASMPTEDASQWHYLMVQQRAHYERRLHQLEQSQGFFDRYSDFPCELVPASVVASDALPYERGRTIRGQAPAGAMVTTRELFVAHDTPLPPNLAVLATTGLVGQVVTSGEFTARLRLVTDRKFQLPAQIWRDPAIERKIIVRVAGSEQSVLLTAANNTFIDVKIKGDGANGLIVDDVPFDHVVQPGDWFVTRGHSLEMPGHVRIAQVKKVTVHKSNNLMRVVYAEPLVDLSALRDVYIVKPLSLPAEDSR
ncbi:MAG: rod shape-determining protein MreC [Phycisphaerae bacterium]|nr:rod shape-determining protein MreC [Phycisphaerae bacterium]